MFVIVFPTWFPGRTNDTQVSTTVSMVIQKVGLTIHWSRIMY